MKGSILIAGATSDAGKSVVTAGICRWLARQGCSVAPFKAQNMSNNSAVTPAGGEIGRAQAMQAAACGIVPDVLMNPLLLKPGSDRQAHVVLHGKPYAEASALGFRQLKTELRAQVLASYDELRSRYDVVVCEGAGSPAEINLRDGDLANMWLATERGLPTLIVGDIDRGGVFAGLFGTVALLSARDQSLIAGFVVNKFRGDERLLQPGLRMLGNLTGRPVLGVLPWLSDLVVDAEDSLSVGISAGGAKPYGREGLEVVAVRLPRTSNTTDLDALACEPGVSVRWSTSPAEIAGADLAVLPGSRATVTDLQWLRERGIAEAIAGRANAGRPVLGICGGYQMLAETIVDNIESGAGTVTGLGLLPTVVRFAAEKTLGRPIGSAFGTDVVTAYEIRHGVCSLKAGGQADEFLDGYTSGAVWGTSWHGVFDSDGFRRAFLAEVAVAAGREFTPDPNTTVSAIKDHQLDRLADLIADHLDTEQLTSLITSGAPAGLRFIPPGAPT
jgi:adenosylcobyric acid synthase